MANPWDNDPVVSNAPQGGPTYGPPPKVDPYKARDQELQEAAAARAVEDQAFQRQKFEREMAAGVGVDGKVSEAERTAAFLATRVGGGMTDIQRALKDNPGADKPQVGATMAGALPMIGNVAHNWLNSPERQRIEAAQMDVLDAALTLGTGAAYSKEQLAGYQQAYFPQIGDDDATITDKRLRLRRLFESAKLKAGGSAPQIDAALAALDAMGGAQVNDETGGGSVVFKDQQPELKAPRMTPEQQAAYDALVSSGATPDQLRAFGQSIGMNIDNADAVANARNQGAGFVPSEQAIYNEEAYRNQLDQQLGEQGYQPSVAQPFQRGITAGLADEISGLGAGGRALINNEPVIDAYTNQRDLHRRATERSYETNLPGSLVAELGGGAVLPGGAANDLKSLARVGAVQGGVAGFGYGDGPTESLAGLVLGAPVGAAIGAGLGLAGPRLSGMVSSRRNAASEVSEALPIIQAGERQGIPIRQPDARPSTRADFAGVEASETGNPIVTRTLNADRDAVQARVGEVGGQGHALDDFDMGQRIQKTGSDYLVKTRSQANALYGRAEQKAGNAAGQATDATAAIDRNIQELKASGERTNSGAIKYLEDLKADLQGGASITKLRSIRTNVRGQINERNLSHTDTERRVGDVLDGMSRDVERILPPDARAAFKNADRFYRERQQFKDQVIRRFVGPKNDPISPEDAARRFQSFMKSKDYGRFSRMIDEMDPGDRADIAATVAESLGTGRDGKFSLAALSTNVENMSPKALEKVFGKDGAAALDDLRIIARAKADTAGGLNSSRTGVVANRMGVKDAVMGIFGGSVAGIPGAIGAMALRNVSEKIGNRRLANALLSPDFSKWLKNAPNNPAAAKPYIGRLTAAAARNAGAAADIKAIQSALMEAFAQSPGRAAAEQEDKGGQEPPK